MDTDEPTQITLGRRIKERRLILGLTQQELADALNFTPQHISALEQGQRNPSISSLARFAEELGVTVDYLITGKEDGVVYNMKVIPAIKADKRLNVRAKKALVQLVEELHKANNGSE